MIPDLTGKQLDTYRLVRRLGGGTFGDVYEATDLHNGKRVAVKVMEPLKTQQAIQQFFNEVRALVRLRQAHIVPVLDFGVDSATGIPFIVMEYAPNGSLRQRHPRGTQVPLRTVVQYVKSLAEALQCAHDDKLIHRDIKPDNVLLGSNGELLLGDFGIATPSSSLRIDLNQPVPPGIAGTAYYMAPEQCRGKPEKASDQYALAIMAYQWLCGQPPFTQGNVYNIYHQHIHEPVPPLHEQLPNIPPKVEAIIMQALAKNPADRFASVRAFAEALEAVTSAPPIGTTLLIYRGHGDGKSAFAWSPDGKLFATGGASGLIQLWDAATGTLIRTFDDVSTGYVSSIAWSPDGTRLASGSTDKTVQVWEASSGRLLRTYSGHAAWVWAVAWSPDGSRLASGSGDKTVQVWEASSGRLLHSYSGHAAGVEAVAWSPDGTWLASGSSDHTVQVWEASSGRRLRTYSGHAYEVRAVAWS